MIRTLLQEPKNASLHQDIIDIKYNRRNKPPPIHNKNN